MIEGCFLVVMPARASTRETLEWASVSAMLQIPFGKDKKGIVMRTRRSPVKGISTIIIYEVCMS